MLDDAERQPPKRRWRTWIFGRHGDARHPGGHGVRRVVHQRPHRRSRGRRRAARPKVADGVRMLVVPGSMRVRAQAESEGLVRSSPPPAQWRQAGCSMCLGMNPDQLAPGQRCASTSNRNFEGRQGKGGRTHLVSPAVAAATAVRGTLSSPADLSTRGDSHEPFRTHTGIGVPLRRSNVDTDQIIPAVYLKRVTRTGFEDGLFAPGATIRRLC